MFGFGTPSEADIQNAMNTIEATRRLGQPADPHLMGQPAYQQALSRLLQQDQAKAGVGPQGQPAGAAPGNGNPWQPAEQEQARRAALAGAIKKQ